MAKQDQVNKDAVALAQRKYDNDIALEKAKVGIALDRKAHGVQPSGRKVC